MASNFESDFWEPAGRVRRERREPPPSGPYLRDREDETRLGSVILVIVASLAAILVIAGLIYATGASARNKAALAAAGCEPSLSPSGLPCTTVFMLHSWYTGITDPAIRQLNADAAAYAANERRSLVAAEAALTSEVTTEQALDNGLIAARFTPQNRAKAMTLITNATSFGNPVPSAAITFTPQLTVLADVLIKDIQAVSKLTGEQARSTSLSQLRSFNRRVDAATAAAAAEIGLVLKAVDTHPTASQEN
jgi:hypothetical protein